MNTTKINLCDIGEDSLYSTSISSPSRPKYSSNFKTMTDYGPVGSKMLEGLRKSMQKAGCDPCVVEVEEWSAEEAYRTVWGVKLSTYDSTMAYRVQEWVAKWVVKENAKSKYSSDSTSFYNLRVGMTYRNPSTGRAELKVQTGSFNHGD